MPNLTPALAYPVDFHKKGTGNPWRRMFIADHAVALDFFQQMSDRGFAVRLPILPVPVPPDVVVDETIVDVLEGVRA